MSSDSTIPAISDFEIMTKAREVRELAVETEIHHLFHGLDGQVQPEFVAAVESEFHDIPAAFKQFTGYDSDTRDAVTESMTQLRNQLTETVVDDINHVSVQLSGWTGPRDGAAETFRANFLGRLPEYLNSQVALIIELDGALRTANNIAATSQRDLLAIADRTIRGLELTATGPGDDADVSYLVLDVLGVTASVVDTSLTHQTAGLFSLTGQRSKLTVDGVSWSIPGPAGKTPRAVVYSMHSAIDKLAEATRAKDKALAEALRSDLEYAEDIRGSHLEPSFADRAHD